MRISDWSSDVCSSDLASQSHKPFSEKELARLRNEGTPVFVDFTADWCLTCKVNDKIGIDTEATKNALQSAGVVTLVGDWTNSDPQITRFLATHGRTIGRAHVLPPVTNAHLVFRLLLETNNN